MSVELILAPAIPPEKTISIAPSTLVARDGLLERARAIEQVAGELSQNAAGALVVELQDFAGRVEDARTKMKAPYLASGKRIDQICKDAVDGIEAERKRLKNLVTQFQLEERRKADEAQRELDELKRKREQAVATGDGVAVMEADAKAAEVITQAAPPPRVAGMAVGFTWKIECHDPAALYRTFPELCKPPEPKIRDCQSALTRMELMEPNKPPTLPGCTVTKEGDTKFR